MATKLRVLCLMLVLVSAACAQSWPAMPVIVFSHHDPQPIPVGTFYIGDQAWAVRMSSRNFLVASDCGPQKKSPWCVALTDCDQHTMSFAVEERPADQPGDFAHEVMHALTSCRNRVELTHAFIYDVSESFTNALRDPRNREYAEWYI